MKNLYLELAELLATITEIKWIDLWHNQVNFIEDEHEFPTPAVFLSFRALNADDMAQNIQNLELQVEVYLYFETFADTYKDSVNQESALAFLDILNKIYIKLQGTEGTNYQNMRRIGFNAVDTGGAGNLYQTVFNCTSTDFSAQKTYLEAETDELNIINEILEPEITITGLESMFERN
ncbi:MAG: hypothetical protein ACEQSR_01415 [Candidatus Methylacidiphilales bacterium]